MVVTRRRRWRYALAERLGLVKPTATEGEFRVNPAVRLAAELMDPLHGVPIPPGPSAAEIRDLAGEPRRRDGRAERRWWLASNVAARRVASWQAGHAVRRDWPDGTHELVGFRCLRVRAERFAKQDQAYWRRGPLRPCAYAVVVISRRDFRLHAHRHDCRSPDCPTAAASVPDRKELPR